jgi:hypothetical protein
VPVDVVFPPAWSDRRFDIDVDWGKEAVGTGKLDDPVGCGEDGLEIGLDIVPTVDIRGETETPAVLVGEDAVVEAILRPQVPDTA